MADKCVCIVYNGVLLVPTPMISLSRSYQDAAGRHIGSTLSVNINGKIVQGGAFANPNDSREAILGKFLTQYPCNVGGLDIAPNGMAGICALGIDKLLLEEQRMRKVFERNYSQLSTEPLPYPTQRFSNIGPFDDGYVENIDTNKFKLYVNGTLVVEGYAKVNSYSSDSENFINTINYSAELSIEEPKELFSNSSNLHLISSYSDNITIEPIEDSNAINPDDPILNVYFGTAFGGNPAFPNTNIDRHNYLYNTRYNISRTIEAVGKHSNNTLNTTHLGNSNLHTKAAEGTALGNARFYVLDRLKHFPTDSLLSNDYICVNRVKSLTHDDAAGSFRITENSMAIDKNNHPSWIDDWTVEISIDNTFLQTVRINGTIRGLETYGTNILTENASIMDGSQPGSMSVTQNGTLVLANQLNSYTGSLPDNLLPTENSTLGSTHYSGEQKISKYQNALQGMYYLKNLDSTTPYNSPIFRRAELFFLNTVGANGTPGGRNNNPYRWLNSNNILVNRSILPSNVVAPAMNPIPVNITESHRKHVGEIDYSFEFNNRPLNLIPGSVSETLNINDTFPSQQIAEIFVLGRKLGPVLQNLGTVTSSTRDITFEVVLPRPRALAQRYIFPTNIFERIMAVVEQLNPKYTFGTTSFPASSIKSYVKNDNQSYDPLEGRIRIQKTWVWQRAK